MIRLLVADDHPAFRRGLQLMLADTDDISIEGEAATGAQAVELANQLAPDVILMDLRMPDLDGIEATRRLSRNNPAPAIVVLTMFEDDDSVLAAMRAGARGYLLKGARSTTTAFPALTERERQVLELIAAGKGNASIAHELMINLKTVRNHVSNIFTKLQVSDRSAAIVRARQSGLGGT